MQRFILSFLVLLVALPLRAAESTPESAIRAYFSALQRDGIVAAADHIHPAELERFKSMVLPVFSGGSGTNKRELIRTVFGPTATEATAAAASPRNFMRALLGVAAKQPGIATLKIQTPEIVGSVHEAQLVHVITRTRIGDGELSIAQMEVTSVKKDGDKWRMMLSRSLEGMAQGLRQQPKDKP